jgi:16S rRNA (uracil1498-N3)-methyltransferase
VVRGPILNPREPATSIGLLLLQDMAARFYTPDLNPSQQIARLPADEARHLVKVLRLAPGAIVGVFDGRGHEWRARVETAGREGVEVLLLEPVPAQRPAVEITLVQAVLKGEPMDSVVRDCTMVGIAALQPVLTARTTVKTSVTLAAPERWRRIALASAKQCGAARLPAIGEVMTFEAWLQHAPVQSAFILVEPSAAVGPMKMRQLASGPVPSHATLIVGPEGGWTADERDRAIAAGCSPVSLGPMTLRADAVALAAAAILCAMWDE